MKTSIALACVTLALTLAGCASTQDNLQRASAMQIGRNTLPESVAISNVQRGAMSVTWTATAPSGTYACSADDMVRRPYCAARGER